MDKVFYYFYVINFIFYIFKGGKIVVVTIKIVINQNVAILNQKVQIMMLLLKRNWRTMMTQMNSRDLENVMNGETRTELDGEILIIEVDILIILLP